MRTPRKDLGLLYFERGAVRARSRGWLAHGSFLFSWYDPRRGAWQEPANLVADGQGILQLPAFPEGEAVAGTDWAAKIVAR
jgi:hypothetical protein